jgi:hypothetical protein
MIGVRRSTVTDIARVLQEAHVLNYARGQIHIENVEVLKKYSCECHQVVRANYQALLGTAWPGYG